MKLPRLIALLAILFIVPCLTGCAATGTAGSTTQPSAINDPTVRLTLVLNGYNSAEEELNRLDAAGFIPAKDKPAIAMAVHAARAAIDSAYAHKDDSQDVLKAAVDQASSAMIPVAKFLATHQKPPNAKGGP